MAGACVFESYEEMVKVARNVLKSGYPLVTSVKAHMLRSSIASDVEIIKTIVITDATDNVQLERYDASCDKVLHAYEQWTDASTSHDFNVANPQLSQVGFSPSELANTILYDVGQNILSVLIRGGTSTQLAMQRFIARMESLWILPEEATISSEASRMLAAVKQGCAIQQFLSCPQFTRSTPKDLIRSTCQYYNAASSSGTVASSKDLSLEELFGLSFMETAVYRGIFQEVHRLEDHLQQKLVKVPREVCSRKSAR